MKSSCVLLASCLAGAYAAEMFQITIKTGFDEAVGLLANLDEVERTFRSASQGFGASVTAPATFCQAYSDPDGKDELGAPFFLDHDVTFAPDSGPPVDIGSFRCADRLAKLLLEPPTHTSSSTASATPAPTAAPTDGGQPQAQSIRVQFRTEFETFVQGDVPFNQLFKLTGTPLGTTAIEAMIVTATGVNVANVKCQLFQDDAGNFPIGGAFSTIDIMLSPPDAPSKAVTVKSIKCT